MAKVFTEWTVLPHKPLQKPEDNLWFVEGKMPGKGGPRRVMTVARMKDGRLVIHNGIALEAEQMAALEAFGEPAVLVVPNGFHRQDARIYKDRYPKLFVTCPAAARKRVEQVVPVDGDYAAAPSDDSVRLSYLEGCKQREGLLEVRSKGRTTLVFNDCLTNFAERQRGVTGFVLAPTGLLAVPRVARLIMVSNKPAFRGHLERLASPELGRIIVSHGDAVEDEAPDRLRSAAALL